MQQPRSRKEILAQPYSISELVDMTQIACRYDGDDSIPFFPTHTHTASIPQRPSFVALLVNVMPFRAQIAHSPRRPSGQYPTTCLQRPHQHHRRSAQAASVAAPGAPRKCSKISSGGFSRHVLLGDAGVFCFTRVLDSGR